MRIIIFPYRFIAKYYIISVVATLSFLLFSVESLKSNNDSLITLIQSQESPDTLKINALNTLCRSLLSTNPDSSISLAKQASELSIKINDKHRKGTSLKNVGLGYFYKADFVNVLSYWTKSLEAFQEIKDSKGTANLLSNIGAVYYETGDNEKAVEYYYQSLRIAEESGDDLRVATVLQNLGAVYETTKEFDKAENYLVQAYEICKVLEYDKGVGTVALNLGDIYMQQNEISLAESYFNIAKEYFEKNDDNYLPTAYIMLGTIERIKGNLNDALKLLTKALELANEKDSNLAKSLAYNGIGEVYLARKQAMQARAAFNKAMALGVSIGTTEELKESYEGLIKAYKLSGNFKSASRLQDSLIKINQSIYDSEKNKSISNLQLSYDIESQQNEIKLFKKDNELKTEQIAKAKLLRNLLVAIALLLILGISNVIYQYLYIRRTNQIITEEQNKSDKLLLNILPEQTADELKNNGFVEAKRYETATVLFTDFVNFTGTAEKLKPVELVKTIDYYFKHFDKIVSKNKLEKIKTIGDAYMCAGGIPTADNENAKNALKAASEIIAFVEEVSSNPPEGIKPFQIRIGLNIGPIVAGVVGHSKFQYDIWGDTVNVAARMESSSEPNKINVSEGIYEMLKHDFDFTYRGEFDVKNRGKLKMYFYEHQN